MIRATGSRTQLSLAACAIAALMTVSAQAEMIDINLTGFRVDYSTDDNAMHDRVDDAGGNLNPVQSQLLTGSEFNFDGVLVAQYSQSNGEDTYADMLIQNIAPDLTLPTEDSLFSVSVGDNNGTFGLDWFYDDGGTIRSLSLDFETVTVGLIYNDNAAQPTLLVTGSTNDWSQSDLPAGIVFDPGSSISFSFITANTMVLVEGESLDVLAAGVVVQISGEGEREIVIPEPPTVSLALLAMCALAVVIRFSNPKKQLQELACPINSRAT